MWKAVLIHRGGATLPPLGEYSDWQAALTRCVEHVGAIAPGRYRLKELGVDRVRDTAVVFAILTHPRSGWILNAIAPREAPPTLEEVEAFLGNRGFARDRWVWLHNEGEVT